MRNIQLNSVVILLVAFQGTLRGAHIGNEFNNSTSISCSRGKIGTELCKDESACCQPLVRCPAHVRVKDIQTCVTLQGHQGVCCTTGSNHTGNI